MSRGVPRQAASLRALAHPVRLRLLSSLTARAMSAAQVARELGIAHSVASYHLRQLADGGHIEVAEERWVRGGRERLYRSVLREEPPTADVDPASAPLWAAALGVEMERRTAALDPGGPRVGGDAELWVDPDLWRDVVARVREALRDLHDAARPPGTGGTVRTSTTVWLFGMEPDAQDAPGPGATGHGG